MTKITYIPGEIANAAIDEHGNRKPVTRTQHIFDDAEGKSQAQINADVDDKFTQLDNEIEGLEKQDVIPVDTLPAVATADPKKIYRVVGEDSYTDHMVNASGDGWKTLATYSFPGIDDEPTAGSDNLLKSGGAYKLVPYTNSFEKTYNLCDEIFELGQINSSNGSNFVNPNRIRTAGFIEVTPLQHYRLSCPTDCYVFCYNSNKEYINTYFQGVGIDIITNANCYYVRLNPVQDYGIIYNKDIVFCAGEEVKPYIPHFAAKDYESRKNIVQIDEDIQELQEKVDELWGIYKVSNTTTSTNLDLLRIDIPSGTKFKARIHTEGGSWSRILLDYNNDTANRLADSNDPSLHNLPQIIPETWIDLTAPADIYTLGLWVQGTNCTFSFDIQIDGDIQDLQERVSSLEDVFQNAFEKSLYVIKRGNTIYTKFRYNSTENMAIQWERFGINNFFHPRYIYKETAPKLNPIVDGTLTLWLENATDWVSPYAYTRALDYPAIENPFTVGGHHGTSGTGGFATMETISVKLFGDGEEIIDDGIYNVNEAKFLVSSNVSACNRINLTTGAKNTSFIENVVWSITPNNLEVSVRLDAVENVSIGGYIGLQMIRTSEDNTSIYFNDGRGKFYNDGTQHTSLPLPFSGNRFVLSEDGKNYLVAVYTDRTVGLGNLSHIGTSPIMYLSSFGKAYAHLIGTQQDAVVMNIGDSVYYRGGYTFADTFNCIGAEKAYIIKLNGENIYCVDFLNAGVANVILPTDVNGKKITVLEKDDSINPEQIVMNNGLKIVATGAGQIQFKM